jgi:GNAT superfamily N-acetyltransferase
MDVLQRNVTVRMTRHHLDNLPAVTLPPGFSIRWYTAGDEKTWFDLQTRTERLQKIAPELHAREFGTDPAPLAKRQAFLCAPDTAVIGTATAWFDASFWGQPFGRVHWVAIVPEMQGRGLAKPLMAGVLQRLRELGHDRAYLVTSTARVPAINLYRRLGFMPDIRSAEDVDTWREWQTAAGVDRW